MGLDAHVCSETYLQLQLQAMAKYLIDIECMFTMFDLIY